MGTIPQVFHRSARAVSTSEFYEAVQATCKPRFPGSRGTTAQAVALAISGGVDSMALAYLCNMTRKKYSNFRVSDNPVGRFFGVVVDHGLREGSDREAKEVAGTVRERIGITSIVVPINWVDESGMEISPHDLPNFETVARQYRYNAIASACQHNFGAVSLFTAHNEDDQYETVLMRLLAGHGYRGLQGMRAATEIPEVYTRHGVYQSGIIDDNLRQMPMYNMRPTRRQTRRVKRGLRDEIDPHVLAEEMSIGMTNDPIDSYRDEFDGIATGSRRAPMLTPMEIEDGGLMLYRPLLPFSKERLIATCLENKIPWFEDQTNHDPTFTMRNAVRYMYKNHELPVALQKPAVLEFAQRCRNKVAAQEGEADRLFKRTIIQEFEPNTGTVVVELPRIYFPETPRRSLKCPVRRQKRIEHYRTITALLIRRLLSPVTPERELPPVKNLDYLVTLLFPSLANGDDGPNDPPHGPPKPYAICGVHLIPLQRDGKYPLRWLLSRAPYPSNAPKPSYHFRELPFRARFGRKQESWPTGQWSKWELYDGRFWVRARHRFPVPIRIAPFEAEHQKAFREGLGSREERDLMALKLKRYAPGKIRYTLPAIYAAGYVDDILEGRDYWERPSHLLPKKPEPEPEPEGDDGPGGLVVKDETSKLPWGLIPGSRLREPGQTELKLVALPTLDIYLPGAKDWVECEFRYKRVNLDGVNQSRRFWIPQTSSGLGGRGIRHRDPGRRRDVRSRGSRSGRRARSAAGGRTCWRRRGPRWSLSGGDQ